jgi:hypothetical protein
MIVYIALWSSNRELRTFNSETHRLARLGIGTSS